MIGATLFRSKFDDRRMRSLYGIIKTFPFADGFDDLMTAALPWARFLSIIHNFQEGIG
jgi:hypothetical protein